ncbi:MAG: VTT domain-containing protein [Bradymonadales bacterium]|nr:VTT domain-containing protein [Bradymonadales bacterium]
MTDLITAILSLPSPLVWLILALAAGIEYVIPPFPGDVIVLGGGILTGSKGVQAFPVFLAVTLGSVWGAALDFEFGRWLARPGTGRLKRWAARPRVHRAVDRVCRGFSKHGDLYLVLNRFLPGIRAFFFVAAGMAGMGRLRTLTLAFLAALLWNGLLLAVGLAIGANLDAILDFARTYSQVTWSALAVVILLLLVRLVVRRGR